MRVFERKCLMCKGIFGYKGVDSGVDYDDVYRNEYIRSLFTIIGTTSMICDRCMIEYLKGRLAMYKGRVKILTLENKDLAEKLKRLLNKDVN